MMDTIIYCGGQIINEQLQSKKYTTVSIIESTSAVVRW